MALLARPVASCIVPTEFSRRPSSFSTSSFCPCLLVCSRDGGLITGRRSRFDAARDRVYHPQSVLSGDSSADDDRPAAPAEESTSHETVYISTSRGSRTVKLLAQERKYYGDRYVKGSIKYQIGLSESYRLREEEQKQERGNREDDESFSGIEASTSGNEDGLWSSKTYLSQLLQERQRVKEVIMKSQTEDARFNSQIATSDEISPDYGLTNQHASCEHETGSGMALDSQVFDEDELLLRQALKKKRQIAEETLRSALRAGELGPSYTKDLMSRMSPFVDRIVTEAVFLKKQPANKNLSFNSRARLYISQCRVVELIKWLKHQNLTAPRIGRLICLGDENLGRIKARVEWLKRIHVKGRELGVVIEREPSILELSLGNLDKTAEILETAGLERKCMGLVVNRSPGVLSLSHSELMEKVSMFSDLGMSPQEFGIMVFNFPAVVGHLSVEEMQSKMEYLRQIGIDNDCLKRIIVSTPQLLACSIEDVWDKLMRYFYYLRIERSGVRRILAVRPSVFCLNLAENIAPKVQFLRAIGVHDEVLGELIVEFPAVLTYSLDKKIRPVVKYLLEVAGVMEADVGKVVARKPEIFGCSVPDKLEVLAKFFLSRNVKSHQLGTMIADFPALLMYSIPVIQPKYQYFKRVMKRPLEDLVAFPRYFSYSLKDRILPRHQLLVKKGLTFSLRHMLACNNDQFSSRVAAAEQRISGNDDVEL